MMNSITDIAGIRVGNADDAALASGVTVILFDEPAVASVDLRGGGTGTRDVALLDPVGTVERIDGIALSGGSAFGIDSASGISAWLAEQGRGFPVGSARVPIVPGAILFDLLSGGDKNWGRYSPYRELGHRAAANASLSFSLGTSGAGFGATTQNLKGGLGSASARTADGITVGALVAVNACGRATAGDGPHFLAAPFEQGKEFGGLGSAPAGTLHALAFKGDVGQNTTIAVVATDAILTKTQAQRVAVMASAGLAMALHPVFSPLDGDVVFAAATGKTKLADPVFALAKIGALAAQCLARAVARGVYEATALPHAGAMLSWRDRFGN